MDTPSICIASVIALQHNTNSLIAHTVTVCILKAHCIYRHTFQIFLASVKESQKTEDTGVSAREDRRPHKTSLF